MEQFKIRCSAINDIMAEPKLKTETLSVGAKTYCENWLKSKIYNREKTFTSKYTDKGNECEIQSMALIEEYLFEVDKIDLGFLVKNAISKENDFLKGTCDIQTDDLVIDIKNSWDCFSFPLFDDKINKDYEAQLQGYMELYDKETAYLIYTLVDTPARFLEKDAYYACYVNGMSYEETLNDFVKNHSYQNLPIEKRVKKYVIERDRDFMKKVNNKVLGCREYINSLSK